MRMTVLASGSKGNSTVIASANTRILVDAGLSCRELLKRMALANEDPAALDAILLTHEHQDHVAGLATLARRLRIPVFLTEPTHREWVRMMTPRTTMTYAQWLDRVQREKEARAAEQGAEEAGARAEGRGEHVPGAKARVEPESAMPGLKSRPISEAIFSPAAPAAGAPSRTVVPSEVGGPPESSTPTAPSQAASPSEVGNPGANSVSEGAQSEDDDTTEETAAPKPGPAYLPAVEYFHSGTRFSIGDISITPFTIPHDAADPCGFVFESEQIRMAIATDLGYMPPNVKAALKRIDVLLLESNHDLEMLKDGPYPWAVKKRVASRVGHLSNHATAEFLARDYDGGAAFIVLGHLSEANNAPELALLSAEQAIGDRMSLLGNRILLAQQAAPLAPISL